MSDTLLRSLFFFNTLFIQILWMLTTPKTHLTTFVKTYTHIRSVPIVLFTVFCTVQIIFYTQLSMPFVSERYIFFEIIGSLVGFIGMALASWTKITMGTNWGRPAQHDKKVQSNLVTSGPFRFTRNPIYVGLLLLFIGQQIALHSYVIFTTPLFFFVIQKAVRVEETLLEKYFGKAYLVYKKRVPRFL